MGIFTGYVMIDWVRVIELRNEIGADGFAEVIELFLEEVESVIGTLGQAPATLPEDLHFLKGSALNLGFRAFGDICRQTERRCTEGTATQADIAATQACYIASKAEFLTRMQEVGTAA